MTVQPVSPVEEVRQAADTLVAAFARGDLDAYFDCFSDDATFLFHSNDALLPSTAPPAVMLAAPWPTPARRPRVRPRCR